MLSPVSQHSSENGRPLPAVCDGGERLATLVPVSPYFELLGQAIVPGQAYRLSRFVYTHPVIGEMVAESPLSHARIVLHDWRAAAVLNVLAQPRRIAELVEEVPGLSAAAASGVMELLLNASMLQAATGDGEAADEPAALQSWEFHDLLFHARTRLGRHDHPAGGTYRFAGRLEIPPALKQVRTAYSAPLVRPDIDRLEREDPPLAWVQEARRSIREFGDPPITARQLGEFLYRVGRVVDHQELEVPAPGGPLPMQFAARPYPAGGGLYELELYVVINQCEGLDRGLYYYNPDLHQLDLVRGPAAEVEALLCGAGLATGIPVERVQVLITIASRVPRIAWKYASIAYSLTLKHVGVLYQTMYLAATAMGLAPCAVGCGDADLFARAAGAEYTEETSVGEFLLGSRS